MERAFPDDDDDDSKGLLGSFSTDVDPLFGSAPDSTPKAYPISHRHPTHAGSYSTLASSPNQEVY